MIISDEIQYPQLVRDFAASLDYNRTIWYREIEPFDIKQRQFRIELNLK